MAGPRISPVLKSIHRRQWQGDQGQGGPSPAGTQILPEGAARPAARGSRAADFAVWLLWVGAGAYALYTVYPDGWFAGACLGALCAVLLRGRGSKRTAEIEERVALLEGTVARLSEALDALRAGAVQAQAASAPAPRPLPDQAAPPRPEAANTSSLGVASKPAAEQPPREAAAVAAPATGLFARVFYGNALAKVGAALLLLALGSLLKLAAEYLQASIEARLGGIALLAATALVFGWRQREARPRIAVALQGAGLGVLYVLGWYMAFGHARLAGAPSLIGGSTAFALLAGAAGAGAVLAYLQRSAALALGAIGAAFVAPVLATADASPQTLILYYALVDVLIFAGSLARDVRSLNPLTFILTLGAGVAWPQHAGAAVALPELGVFFLIYSLAPVIYGMTRGATLRHPADLILVFGVPAMGLGVIGTALPLGYGMASAVFVAGAYYLALGALLRAQSRSDTASLERAHALIGLSLVTVAVPLAFGVTLTAMVLAIEGAALAWYGLRRQHAEFRIAGLLVQLGAGAYFLAQAGELARRAPVANEVFAACVTLALAAFATCQALRRHAPENSSWPRLATPFGVLGAAWWFAGTGAEIARWVPRGETSAAILAFLAVCALAMEILGAWKQWHRTRIAAALFPYALALAAVGAVVEQGHVLGGWMAWVFPPALALAYWQLRRHEWWQLAVPLTTPHVTLAWLACAVVTMECVFLARGTVHPQLWQTVAVGTNLALFALLVSVLCIGRVWPAREQVREMVRYCGLPAIALGVLWVLVANVTSSGKWGYAYVPVFNPLDLSSTFVLALGTWMIAVARRLDPQLSPRVFQWMAWALALGKFWWANATVARSVHHYAGVPYTASAMIQSGVLQAILSVVWTLSALAVMVWGTRIGSRRTWFVGFGLLGVVGLKMVLLDLRSLGSASWTFSLLGIALLVMAAGYFTPTPPKPERA